MSAEPHSNEASAEWELLAELFERALELDEAARGAWLDQRCADRPGLRWELEAMLAASPDDRALELESRVREEAPAPEGGRVGPYRLLRLLARGGMGEVHLAERVDGGFQQLVAVKLLRPGLESTEVLDRFQLERDLLARLTHPAVVPLLDGGTTEHGRPYLVLQYVDGVPITRACEEGGLSRRERAGLFADLCRAVQYAHSNLVVHRDLKPSNILVTPEGEIRLLDFGIAKLLSSEAPDAETTRARRAPMTPSRAAPEQVRGEPVTTATDVWALGVLLHELLTGKLPERAGGPVEGASGTARRVPAPGLESDLAAIVARCLDPDPGARYAAAGALGEDVERWLRGEPVVARPDSLGYRARRFVGRHRAAVGAAAAAVLLLAVLAVTSTLQSRRIARERDRAAAEEAKANAVVDLLAELFAGADPNEGARGDTVSIPELLARGERQAAGLDGQPDVQARLRRALGRIHLQRSEFARALELLGAAREEELARLGASDPRTVPVRIDFARALHATGRLDAAREEMRSTLAELLRDPGHEPLLEARCRLALGSLLRGPEAEREVARALELMRSDPRADPDEQIAALTVLATLARFGGDLAATEARFREAYDLALPRLGAGHPQVLALRSNLAEFLPEPARRVAEHGELARLRRELYGERSHLVANSLGLLGAALVDSGQAERAIDAYREAYSIWSETGGPTNGAALSNLRGLALALELAGRPSEAGYAYERLAHDLVGSRLSARSAAAYRADVAAFDLRRGRLETAEAALGAVIGSLERGDAPPTATRARAEALLGAIALERGDAEPAVERIRDALELLPPVAEDPASGRVRAELRAWLGRALLAAGRPAEARVELEAALPELEASPRTHPDELAAARAALAAARAA